MLGFCFSNSAMTSGKASCVVLVVYGLNQDITTCPADGATVAGAAGAAVGAAAAGPAVGSGAAGCGAAPHAARIAAPPETIVRRRNARRSILLGEPVPFQELMIDLLCYTKPFTSYSSPTTREPSAQPRHVLATWCAAS